MKERNTSATASKLDMEKWYKERLEKIYATLEQVMPGMPALIDELVGRRERINQALNSIAQELGKTLAAVHEDYDKYIDSVRAWGDLGWTLFPRQTVIPFFGSSY